MVACMGKCIEDLSRKEENAVIGLVDSFMQIFAAQCK
jgi:hypothetical protein